MFTPIHVYTYTYIHVYTPSRPSKVLFSGMCNFPVSPPAFAVYRIVCSFDSNTLTHTYTQTLAYMHTYGLPIAPHSCDSQMSVCVDECVDVFVCVYACVRVYVTYRPSYLWFLDVCVLMCVCVRACVCLCVRVCAWVCATYRRA